MNTQNERNENSSANENQKETVVFVQAEDRETTLFCENAREGFTELRVLGVSSYAEFKDELSKKATVLIQFGTETEPETATFMEDEISAIFEDLGEAEWAMPSDSFVEAE